jgi:uncharacterized protein (TIGR02147 family)
MERIFTYIDYRKFLSDYYDDKKKTTRYFSHRYFATRAGFKSPIFLRQIINGERNLTRPMIEKFAVALGLNKKETVFFSNLVLFNQAKTALEKQQHYTVLNSMIDSVSTHKLDSDAIRYYKKWYTSAIRELICLRDFHDNFRLLAQTLKPPITAREAQHSVELLLRLGLIVKTENGAYQQTNRAITSGDDEISLVRRAFNRNMAMLAGEALESFPVDQRDISGITIGISRPCYEVLAAELAAFKERVVSIVDRDTDSSRVYQFNFQLFPLSDDLRSAPPATKDDQP